MIPYLALYIFIVALFGSIPFGYYLSLWVKKEDIRKSGSGNIGATNVTRVLGLKFGLISFMLDFLKGFLPYWVASQWIFPQLAPGWLLLATIPAILGHNFSPFLGFKGGKGVSSTVGLLIAYHPILALWCLAAWLLFLILFGYVSLSSIIALLAAPLLVLLSSWFYTYPTDTLALFLIALLGIFQHRSNIKRLIEGKENRMFSYALIKK